MANVQRGNLKLKLVPPHVPRQMIGFGIASFHVDFDAMSPRTYISWSSKNTADTAQTTATWTWDEIYNSGHPETDDLQKLSYSAGMLDQKLFPTLSLRFYWQDRLRALSVLAEKLEFL